MRAISLWEPWASAIAWELKKIETRSWETPYRGPLAIHAAKTREHASFIRDQTVRIYFEAVGLTDPFALPFGCVVATVDLMDCRPVEELLAEVRGAQELALGNYDAGRFGWVLGNIHRFSEPIPARGAQGFWSWKP